MFEKENPILISMPRTGSTVIGKMLFNIAHHKFGSKNYLNQYTTMSPNYLEVFEKRDGIIQSISYEREKNKFIKEYEQRPTITRQRLQMLVGDNKYTMKLFAHDCSPEIFNFLKPQYDFIFLERRDTISQLLSFTTMMTTNKHEFKKKERFNKAYFDFQNCLSLFLAISNYNKLKKTTPKSTVIYYEDFMDLGGNISALQTLLKLPNEDIPETLKINTVPTPYQSSLEDLLVNKDEWLIHKPTILEFLESLK
jgi:hypothetical protein